MFTTDGNIGMSVIIGVVIFITVFTFAYLNDHLGKKKHATFVNGKIFNELITKMGFKIENHNNNKYWGLKGVYKEYYFKIYYDWNTSLSGRIFTREICIMLYFVPILKTNNSIDIFLLDKLNEKYRDKGIFASKSELKIEASYLQISRAYTIFTNSKDITKQIENAIKIANSENLKPPDEKEVNKLIAEDDFSHGPDIETYNNL